MPEPPICRNLPGLVRQSISLTTGVQMWPLQSPARDRATPRLSENSFAWGMGA